MINWYEKAERWTWEISKKIQSLRIMKDPENWRHSEDQNTLADPTGSFTRNHWRVPSRSLGMKLFFASSTNSSRRFKRICHIHPNGRDYLKAVGGARKPWRVRGFWSRCVLWDDFFGVVVWGWISSLYFFKWWNLYNWILKLLFR